MKYENKKDKTLETIEILENAIVIFDNGDKELFDAIQITNNEVIFGRILNKDGFVEGGCIPKNSIKCINVGAKRTVYKKKP